MLFACADCLNTSLAPIKPFPIPPKVEPTLEVTEFERKPDNNTEVTIHPYTTYVNHLYVYPLVLHFDTQKMFTRARNIACIVELRDSDTEDAKGLQVGLINTSALSYVGVQRRNFICY